MGLREHSAAMQAISVSRVPPLPSGWQAVSYTVLADGSLAVMATDVDLAAEHQRLYAAYQASTPPNPPSRMAELCSAATARVWTATQGQAWTAGPTFRLETPFPQFDRFSDHRWLAVASRSQGEANARVLAQDGEETSRIILGDGIEHVAIDGEDRIWVGWFDEGVFGNDGWCVSGSEWPPSSQGVAAFASDGTVLPSPGWPTEVDPIADCYALNISGPGVWLCPYTDFPIVNLVPGEPARWWRNSLTGAKALATGGNHVLLAGGYSEAANRLALVALDGEGAGESATVLATGALPLRRLPPSKNGWAHVWARPDLLIGRDDVLHLVDDGVWHRWRVPAFARS